MTLALCKTNTLDHIFHFTIEGPLNPTLYLMNMTELRTHVFSIIGTLNARGCSFDAFTLECRNVKLLLKPCIHKP